jgi:Predicted peptidase
MALYGCSDPLSSDSKTGIAGMAALQTPVLRDTQGNVYGYLEYLPVDFDPLKKKLYPVIFYWNGQNAISGNGREDIGKLLTQGLPQYINEGQHYPAIIVSGMLPDWKNNKVKPFIEYILNRYDQFIDKERIYMTGFSAGGGVTMRYAAAYPEHLAAIIPISAAAQPPSKNGIHEGLKNVSSWFFHNSGDAKVEVWRSNAWNRALKALGGEHKITRPDSDSHYAWQDTYSSPEVWEWLLNQRKHAVTLSDLK